MKKLLIILFAFFLFQYPVFADNLRGVWVCTVANLDYPSQPTTNPEILKAETDKIIQNCSDSGFNTIFLQVRPGGDAIYKSSLYPYSYYLTGNQGTPPDNGFDVLKYWIDAAHAADIELHAWINPYRIASAGAAYELSADNPAKKHPEWVRQYNGGLYLDPGIPEVREYVIKGVAEIEKNYDIDGIHIDDYFYPGKDFPDSDTFAKYGQGSSLEDWRRSNTYALVKALGEETDLTFGVSPSGIWANKGIMENGSDTSGASAYFDMYADTLRWAKENIIDYIAPQIYWYNGYAPADYNVLTKWWSEALADCDTKLYIGLGDYRMDAFGSDPGSPWFNGNEILKQMKMNKENKKIEGEIHFRYGSVMNHRSLYDKIKNEYTRDNDNGKDEFCIYIYFNTYGEPIFAKKDTDFSIPRCRSSAPGDAGYARAVFMREGRLKCENVVLNFSL